MSEVRKGELSPRWGLFGELSPNWGMKHSEESKRKISKALKGRKINRDTSGEKNPFYGKSLSEEAKAILRKKAKERYSNNAHPRCKRVINNETGFVYNSAIEAAKHNNINYRTFKSWLTGHRLNKSVFTYER
jgi:hypothetical protein